MTKASFKLYIGTAALLSFAYPSMASKIDIVNENKKELTVKINGEGVDAADPYEIKIPAEHNSTLVINRKDLNNKTFYSIKGDTSNFTPSGRCEYLNVDKNYKVTFLNDSIGTTCIAEEVK